MVAHGRAAGIEVVVRRFARPTRTAAQAAAEIGCSVAEIVKSLVFIPTELEGPSRMPTAVVVLCSGDDRVDEAALAAAVGASAVRRATPDEVRAATGFAIGAVPPFGHSRPCLVIADERLRRYPQVWAAAGLPDAVFPIAPADLVRVSGAREAAVAAAQRSPSSSSPSSDSYSSE